MVIAIVDYGVANAISVSNALKYLNHDCKIVSMPEELTNSSAIILPGVGSFKSAWRVLAEKNLDDSIIEQAKLGKKILGICLGFQLLFTTSEEGGLQNGLNLIKGDVRKLNSPGMRVPHIGFESTIIFKNSGLFNGLGETTDFYYVHSYCVNESNECFQSIGKCRYGSEFLAAFQKDNIYGCQFHPEKSQGNGLRLLDNFARA